MPDSRMVSRKHRHSRNNLQIIKIETEKIQNSIDNKYSNPCRTKKYKAKWMWNHMTSAVEQKDRWRSVT